MYNGEIGTPNSAPFSIILHNNHSGWIFSHSVYVFLVVLLNFKYNKNWWWKWMQNPTLYSLLVIYWFDGYLEPLISILCSQLCYSIPATCDPNGNVLQRLVAANWFFETHVIMVMDINMSIIGACISIFILYKNNLTQWEKRTGKLYWSGIIIFIIALFQQNLVMVMYQINQFLPQFTYSPIRIFQGLDKINVIPVGFYMYSFMYFLLFGYLWWEDRTYVKAETNDSAMVKDKLKRIDRMYIEFLLYILGVTIFCAVPIWSFYYQVWAFWIIVFWYFTYQLTYNNPDGFSIKPFYYMALNTDDSIDKNA